MPYLIVKIRGEETHRIKLTGSVTIGRDLHCNVWIGERGLSRQHCQVTRISDMDERWMVRDLNSRNGVFVHDERVHQHVLNDGDAFRIGDARISFHGGDLRAKRPASPEEALHESLMHPEETLKRDTAAPLKSATVTQIAPQPITPASVNLTAPVDEPLVMPFSLAFQRPAPKPLFVAPTPSKDEPKPAAPRVLVKAGLFDSLFNAIKQLLPRDRDAA